MKIIQIMPAQPGAHAMYRSNEGKSRRAAVVGYALLEFKPGKRGIRPIIDHAHPYGVPDILDRDGNVLLEEWDP